MDIINQNKFSKLLIGVLLLINILAIVIIWVLVSKQKEPPMFSKDGPPPSPVEMMKWELNLSDEQSEQFSAMFKAHRTQIDEAFAKMNKLRDQLSSDLIAETGENAHADSVMYQIGMLQMETEKLRYNHFLELISICTPEQKEKLKPLFKKLLIGKPPQQKSERKPGFNEDNNFPRKPPE